MTETFQYSLHDGVCHLRLVGELRHDTAGELDIWVQNLVAGLDSPVCDVCIDLNQVSFMDSTAIGLLAEIAREVVGRGLPAPTLISNDAEINQLLTSLRFDEVFKLIARPSDCLAHPDDDELRCIGDSSACTGKAILKAHEALIDLNDANRAAFQPVVDLFREQLDKK